MAIVQSAGALVAAHRDSFARPSPTSLRFYGDLFEDYAAIYRTQPNVRLVLRFLARNVAQLNLHAFRRASDTERIRLTDEPVSATIRKPSPRTTRFSWFDAAMHDLLLFDDLFALKVRAPDGRLQLVRIPPTMVRVEGEWLFPTGYRILGNRDQPVYEPDAVFHVHGYNPADPKVGTSAMEALRRILAEERAAGEYREQFWRNGSRISGVIERPAGPKWPDPAKARFVEGWRAAWTGSGSEAGGTPILEDGMTWKPVSMTAKDAEYLGARKLSREEVAAQYHLAPAFVGLLENANFANMREQHRALYQDTLGPWLTQLEEEWAAQVLPDIPGTEKVYVEFAIREKLQGSFEEEAAVLSTATGAPWLTRNETRARQNLPPVAGGDELVVPLNVLVGGQASPRDSAPPAAPGDGPAIEARSRQAGAQPRQAGALPSSRSRSRKAIDDLPAPARGWAEKHVEELARFFGRQRDAVLSKIGAGAETWWDADRWDDELGDELAALSTGLVGELAQEVAEQFGGTYEEGLVLERILGEARSAAERVNSTTRDELDGALDDADDPVLSARHVFEVAVASRAAQIAITRTTSVGNFARAEGARQSGVRSKVWRSSGLPQSRHASLDGETVGIGETFSNGAQWPGDDVLPTDETAGCQCSLDFEQ